MATRTKPEINPSHVMPAKADGTAWWVPSSSGNYCWLVERKAGQLTCKCPDCQIRHRACRHVRAVANRLNLDLRAEAERLASLPKVLAKHLEQEQQVEVMSAERAMEEQLIDALGLREEDNRRKAQAERGQRDHIFWHPVTEAAQRERSARYANALPVDAGEFSIWK